MLLQSALHLEWPDAVACADNHIVSTPDKPEIAILIFIRAVTSDVPVAANTSIRRIGVTPVFLKHPSGTLRLDTHGNITLLARWQRIAVMVNDLNIEPRRGSPHRARLDLNGREVGAEQHRFSLAIPISDGHACFIFPNLYHF